MTNKFKYYTQMPTSVCHVLCQQFIMYVNQYE